MATYEFVTVDVFTDQRFGGNPLAVFPDAVGLDATQMQHLARELNLSETTFVLPPRDPAHTAHVRIFTPTSELPFAGHPNVGTAYVLARRSPTAAASFVFEEAAGLVPIEVELDLQRQPVGARITAPAALALRGEILTDFVARCAGLSASDIVTTSHRPVFASVGVDFAVAELATREALAKARPSLADFQLATQRYPQASPFALHLYVRDRTDPTQIATRMFAPLLGIPEDPATGSANAGLAALLAHLHLRGPGAQAYTFVQGVEMGRPSRLRGSATKLSDGSVRATIAGHCVPMFQGSITL